VLWESNLRHIVLPGCGPPALARKFGSLRFFAPLTRVGSLRNFVVASQGGVLDRAAKREIQENMTAYNFDTIDVGGKPEA